MTALTPSRILACAGMHMHMPRPGCHVSQGQPVVSAAAQHPADGSRLLRGLGRLLSSPACSRLCVRARPHLRAQQRQRCASRRGPSEEKHRQNKRHMLTRSSGHTPQHSVLCYGDRRSARGPLHQALHAQLQRVHIRRARNLAACGLRAVVLLPSKHVLG